jgi:RimJ/RimL family protein N-acetyltransferase
MATEQHVHASTPSAGSAAQRDGDDQAALRALLSACTARGWPPAQLESCLQRLLQLSGALPSTQRSAWMAGLGLAWQRHGWAMRLPARRMLLRLAYAWDIWPLAHRIGAALDEAMSLDSEDAACLLEACRQLGDGERALCLSVRRQLLEPREPAHAHMHRSLLEWLHWRAAAFPVAGSDWGEGELSLEPLAHHHLGGFGWQYDDPDITHLCCLPGFDDADEWHAWLDRAYTQDGQQPYAVLHADWGFVGCVSLVMHGDIGFFYYWLGRDFRGLGLGPRAVSLLLADARERRGLRCCYAKVFDYNEPSRRALAKLGFADLGIHGTGDDNDQLFYRWGEHACRDQAVSELHWLLDRMDSATRAAAPLVNVSSNKEV